MDPDRFDRWTRTLADGVSRRRVLGGLTGAALGALGAGGLSGPRLAGAAKGGNSACAAFCAQVFGNTRAAGQCTSQAAHGQGLCYQCGPQGDGSQQLCGQSCVGTCPRGADVSSLCTCGEHATCCPGGCRCDFDETTNAVQCFDVRLIRDGGIPCSTDAECPIGASCNTFSGLCNPDDCDEFTPCPTGAACHSGACFAYCSA